MFAVGAQPRTSLEELTYSAATDQLAGIGGNKEGRMERTGDGRGRKRRGWKKELRGMEIRGSLHH